MSQGETDETKALIGRIAKNLTILIVEHDMQVVMELCDRITVFHYGEDSGRRHAGGDSAKPQSARGLSEDMSAAEAISAAEEISVAAGMIAPLVAVEAVHTYYGKSHILHGVSIEVGPGEVVGLLGRNGVGKSYDAEDHHGPHSSEPGGGAALTVLP